METDCRQRIFLLQRPEEDDDCLEWTKPCHNRRRTDLNQLENSNEC